MRIKENTISNIVDKIKVAILEDDKEYCNYLKKILIKEKRIKIYGEFNSSQDFLQILDNPFKPDVCLIDIVLEGCPTGLDCVKIIRQRYPNIHIIIITSHTENYYISKARKLNADFIEKGTRGEILINKIITSANYNTEQFLSLSNKQNEFDLTELTEQMDLAQRHIEKLSKYQRIVLKLKLEGKSINETAVILGMNHRTVRTHLRRALVKLKLPNLFNYIKIDRL